MFSSAPSAAAAPTLTHRRRHHP